MTESSGTILIVEDDAPIRKFLRISLEAHGFRVLEARLGRDGLELCAEEHPDVVILDLGLPDMDGQEFIPEVRGWSSVPIIVLSVRSDETEKVTALDAGADDYVTKPFGISELMARIRTAQRNRKPSAETARIKAGPLEVDLTRHEVWLGGEPVHLSKKEYELLKLFINNPDRVLTHRQILRDVWGPTHVRDTHYLRVLIGHLRQRLGDIPSDPRYIITIQGVGYRFVREPETE
ncbi:response regulator [Thiohalomonas denitrificans]|uniref:response regulator n=1 Tax=Thiohalomonas denitrificans TaxID=415747 RepID=UPI0026EEE945|nr:response regulator [Thiohalomonas denitrificans]